MLIIPWPFMEKASYSDTTEAIYNYRLYSGLNFNERTEKYMKSFGRFEIAMKTIVLVFYLRIFCRIWKVRKSPLAEAPRNMPTTFCVIGGLLFAPLICNILNYIASGIDAGVKMCNLNMMWINYVGLIFDIIKRFKGMIIFIRFIRPAL
jgi:hypothetical protein